MRLEGNIRFGPFELDLETGELRRDGCPVKLSPKPWRALALLAKAQGRLVTRETIRKELWDSDTHVDFEHALNFCIREIRSALGDDAKKPRYIENFGTPRLSIHRGNPAERRNRSGTGAGTEALDAARQLEAYGYYESARKSFGQAGKESLENARRDFQRALDILPGYALAHSGLGSACALCSLNRRNPEDLDAAQST